MTRPDSPPRPRGFTLVELLVVLLILAVLIALLVPAISGAVAKARGAAVQAEINALAQSLNDFKSKMGDYPPSGIMINERGNIPTVFPTGPSSTGAAPRGALTDITLNQLGTRSITAFRKFWPRVAWSTGYQAYLFNAGNPTWYDFNGDGVMQDGYIILSGSECLVFFLGGIPLNNGTTVGMNGFAKDPTNPFRTTVANLPNGNPHPNYTNNRNPPFYEFDGGRLRFPRADMVPWAAATNPRFYLESYMPAYVDSLGSQGSDASAQNFYAYFSTNMGTGYDPNDCNINDGRPSPFEVDGTSVSGAFPYGLRPLGLDFRSVQPLAGGAIVTRSPSPNPYTSGPSAPSNAAPTYHNPQTFQIFSPGPDGVYGVGGMYAPTTNTPLPAPGAASNAADSSIRNKESDNYTNFHNGKLE